MTSDFNLFFEIIDRGPVEILGYFRTFFLLCGHFCTSLHEILGPGLNLIFKTTLFYKKKITLTNRSRVNNPPILTQKQPKVAIFHKTDFLGLKYPPEARVEPKTCSTICGTSVLAISNHKNSAGTAGGAREGQNMAHLGHININGSKRVGGGLPGCSMA